MESAGETSEPESDGEVLEDLIVRDVREVFELARAWFGEEAA